MASQPRRKPRHLHRCENTKISYGIGLLHESEKCVEEAMEEGSIGNEDRKDRIKRV
jgi:hypothetical protein